MSTVTDRHLDLASLQTAWQGLNKLVLHSAMDIDARFAEDQK